MNKGGIDVSGAQGARRREQAGIVLREIEDTLHRVRENRLDPAVAATLIVSRLLPARSQDNVRAAHYFNRGVDWLTTLLRTEGAVIDLKTLKARLKALGDVSPGIRREVDGLKGSLNLICSYANPQAAQPPAA